MKGISSRNKSFLSSPKKKNAGAIVSLFFTKILKFKKHAMHEYLRNTKQRHQCAIIATPQLLEAILQKQKSAIMIEYWRKKNCLVDSGRIHLLSAEKDQNGVKSPGMGSDDQVRVRCIKMRGRG